MCKKVQGDCQGHKHVLFPDSVKQFMFPGGGRHRLRGQLSRVGGKNCCVTIRAKRDADGTTEPQTWVSHNTLRKFEIFTNCHFLLSDWLPPAWVHRHIRLHDEPSFNIAYHSFSDPMIYRQQTHQPPRKEGSVFLYVCLSQKLGARLGIGVGSSSRRRRMIKWLWWGGFCLGHTTA